VPVICDHWAVFCDYDEAPATRAAKYDLWAAIWREYWGGECEV